MEEGRRAAGGRREEAMGRGPGGRKIGRGTVVVATATAKAVATGVAARELQAVEG